MNYREIIREAWAETQKEKRLMWWFAFPSAVIGTLVSIVYVIYQALAFQSSEFFNANIAEGEESLLHIMLSRAYQFVTQNEGLGLFLILILVVLAILYLLLPVFTEGALVTSVSRIRQGRSVGIGQGIGYGFSCFLKLFEFHLLIRGLGFYSMLTEMSFAVRHLGPDSFSFLGWIFLLFLFVSIIIGFLTTYARYFLILEGHGVFESLLASGKLVVKNLHQTLFMLVLMAIISLRVIVNVILALLIPSLIAIPIFILSSFTFDNLGIIFGFIAGIVAIYFAGYFMGIFNFFTTTVWTFTFMELRKEEQEDGPSQTEEPSTPAEQI